MTLLPLPTPPPAPGKGPAIVAAALRRFGHVQRGEPQLHPESVLNENYRVETDAGTRFVRLHRKTRQPARLAAEVVLLDWLAGEGLPVVLPERATDGQAVQLVAGRRVTVWPWVEGFIATGPHLTPAAAALLGEMQGRLHAHLARYPRADDFPAGGSGATWDVEAAIAELSRVDDLIRYYPAPGERRLQLQGYLREKLALLEAGVARAPEEFAHLPSQLVHGDYHERNVILAPAGDSIAAVVDWELASRIPRIFELVRALEFSGAVQDEALARAWLDGYRTHASLARDECEAGVAMWFHAQLANTWAYRRLFIEGDAAVDRFFDSGAEQLRRWNDPSFRERLIRLLATG